MEESFFKKFKKWLERELDQELDLENIKSEENEEKQENCLKDIVDSKE